MWNSTFGDSMGGGTGFFSEFNQGESPPKKAKGQPRRAQSVTPICIRQVQDYPEEEFKLFGMPTHILAVVGILKEFEVDSTKATYTIEDHTGTIKAIWWLQNESESALDLPLVKEGRYVKVYSSLKVVNGEKLLMALRMFPVDDPNQITTHLLEVIHARLAAEKAGKDTDMLGISRNNPGMELANSMSFMDVEMNLGSNENNSFTPLQQKVYSILQPVNTASGLHRAMLLQNFPTNQHREVNAALDFLVSEGHAYSTIDNDHFKATDSM